MTARRKKVFEPWKLIKLEQTKCHTQNLRSHVYAYMNIKTRKSYPHILFYTNTQCSRLCSRDLSCEIHVSWFGLKPFLYLELSPVLPWGLTQSHGYIEAKLLQHLASQVQANEDSAARLDSWIITQDCFIQVRMCLTRQGLLPVMCSVTFKRNMSRY